jgi:hypothetical protein
MFEIELPELDFIDVDIEPRPLLHAKGGRAPVSGRVSIGRPDAHALTPDSVSDAAAQGFLRSQTATKRYTLIAMAANFYPGDDPFADAKVSILLQGDPGAAEPPVARCLTPDRSASPVEHVTKVALDADLKFFRLGVEHEVRQTTESLFVVAAGEGCADPEWTYRATSAHRLVGIQQMALIAEAPAGIALTADISLAATLLTRRFGRIGYRARVLDCTITLPPTS